MSSAPNSWLNSGTEFGSLIVEGAITHQVKCNMFFKEHVERARIDVCNLGKTEVILGMPWLAAHNQEIDWEKGEVRMTQCLPICGKRKQEEKGNVRGHLEWCLVSIEGLFY